MFGLFKKPDQNIRPRDTLFGDHSLEYWAGINSQEIPWSLFKRVQTSLNKNDKEAAIKTLNEIIGTPGLESRHYLQAYSFLSELNVTPKHDIQLYGVVVEVMMEEGLDLLAVYADHSARYYNYTGGSVIWDLYEETIANKIDNILSLSNDTVSKIGPWKDKRLPPPRKGFARINFLTSHGLHFGEAEQRALFQDVLASKIMYGMLDMMETLTDKVRNKKKAG